MNHRDALIAEEQENNRETTTEAETTVTDGNMPIKGELMLSFFDAIKRL